MAGKKTRKKSSAKKAQRRRSKWTYLIALAFVGAAIFAVYCAWLDVQVRHHFENASWSLPAKVYARPLELYAGKSLDKNQLVSMLNNLGYRHESKLRDRGSYRLTSSGVDLYSRQFTFWDGPQKAQKIRVRFSGQTVSSLQSLGKSGSTALVRLDPLFIGSIYPAHSGADRILVRLDEVPPLLPAGLIEVEDRDFLRNHGISLKGIARAAWADLRAGAIVQGGSTLTQQLVKNLFLTNRQTLSRKIKGALMSILLESHYSKEAILETYLNEVYLGQDGARSIHGFGLGSYFYFKKPLNELEPQEIALLIALVKGPSYYNPRTHPERAIKRRNLVLRIFAETHLITAQQAQKAKQKPLQVVATPPGGTTQYPAFIDLVRRQLHSQYSDKDLTSEGLRIFTTLNPRVQKAADHRVRSTLADIEKSRQIKEGSLQAAAVVTSVSGGRVLGIVGGSAARYTGYNRALDAYRQIGSLMKPVVYLTALENPDQYNLVTPLDDTRLIVKLANGKTWIPQNYDRKSHGHPPLYKALSHSYNVATSRLALQIGIPDIIKTLKKLGYPGTPAPLPSLALGAVGLSPLQVAQIYNTLAGGGYYTPLRAIKAVTTRNGKPLNRYPLKIQRVVDSQSVYLLDWILQRVTHHGTGQSAYHVLPKSLNVAGKTGTSSQWRDSWFAGFSGNRVIAVWVGRDDDKNTHLTGATGALQIWTRIMHDIDARSFSPVKPAGVTSLKLVLKDKGNEQSTASHGLFSGFLSGPDCSKAVAVPFITGYVPDGLEICGQSPSRPDNNQQQNGHGHSKSIADWFRELF